MSDNFSENKPKKPSHIVYTVDENNDTQHWQKIGAAWPTKGDGFSLKLSSVPLNGNVVLRSREELERMRAERQQSNEQNQSKDMQQKP